MASVWAVVVLACCCFSGIQASSPPIDNYSYDYDPSPAPFDPPTEASPQDLQEQLQLLSARVEKLEGEGKSKVAFAASLVAQAERTYVGPYSKDTTLVFNKVTTNVGNAYNRATGIFRAPQRGVYYLRFTVNVGNIGSVNAALLKNGENMFAVYETAGVHNSGANGVALQLEEGDEVSVVIRPGYDVFDNSKLSTFSGFLIFPM